MRYASIPPTSKYFIDWPLKLQSFPQAFDYNAKFKMLMKKKGKDKELEVFHFAFRIDL